MFIANLVLALSVLPVLLYLLWNVFRAGPKPRWVAYLPAAGLGAIVLHGLLFGFTGVLVGVYFFSLLLFLLTLRGLRGEQSHTHRRLPVVLGGLLAVGAFLLSLVPAVLLPVGYTPPEPTGPYAVGTVTYGWEDAARLEAFTPDPADHRKIAVQFWYPVDGKARMAREGAPVSADQERYPLVVFSHGAFGFRGSNTSTYLELASRGYIVASIDHAYHSFFTSYPDGSQAIISQEFLAQVQANQSGAGDEAENAAITFGWLDLRLADIRFTLDQAQSLDEGPLVGHIDMEKIGLFGHSLGGAASAAVCRVDPRCKAAAVIDATMFGEYRRDAAAGTLLDDPFPAPLLVFYNGDTFHATAEHLGYVPDIHAVENAAGPAFAVVVNGAQHLNFTDLPGRAPLLARLLGKMMNFNGGTAGEIPQFRCTTILNSYLVEFFDITLRGTSSTLLAGDPVFTEVEFNAK